MSNMGDLCPPSLEETNSYPWSVSFQLQQSVWLITLSTKRPRWPGLPQSVLLVPCWTWDHFPEGGLGTIWVDSWGSSQACWIRISEGGAWGIYVPKFFSYFYSQVIFMDPKVWKQWPRRPAFGTDMHPGFYQMWWACIPLSNTLMFCWGIGGRWHWTTAANTCWYVLGTDYPWNCKMSSVSLIYALQKYCV